MLVQETMDVPVQVGLCFSINFPDDGGEPDGAPSEIELVVFDNVTHEGRISLELMPLFVGNMTSGIGQKGFEAVERFINAVQSKLNEIKSGQ